MDNLKNRRGKKGREKRKMKKEDIKKGVLEEILYVGVDDSNHAGKTKGEIIVATFSFYHKDSLVRKFPNKREYELVKNWFEDRDAPKDFRFTVLFDEKYRHISNNLPVAAPYLIRNFLKDNQNNRKIKNIKIYFDGRLVPSQKKYMREVFSDFPKVVVDNFIKKRGIHRCPFVVYSADVMAHSLYKTEISKLLEHPKLVNI